MDKITVVRHLRTEIEPTLDADGVLHHGTSNLGGITFLFDLSFTQRGQGSVRYAYALCRSDENFNKREGIRIATEKLANNDAIVLDDYNPKESLLYNVFLDLYEKADSKDPIFADKKLYRLRTAMKRIIDRTEHVNEILDSLGA